jgi:hypothetical protein
MAFRSLLKFVRGVFLKAIYSLYVFISRYLFSFTRDKSALFSLSRGSFEFNGFFLIHVPFLKSLQGKVDDIFSCEEVNCLQVLNNKFKFQDAYASAAYPYNYLTKSQIDSLQIVESIMQSNLYDELCDISKSFLKIANVSIWRTYPNSFYDGGSFIWHRDSMPLGTIKLLVYLSDVDIDSGPLNILPRTNNNLSYLPGFGNSRAKYLSLELDQEYSQFPVIGSCGDGLIFDTNCLHFAGRTSNKPITILSIHFQPHHSCGRRFFEKFSFPVAPTSEYSLTPWTPWWSNY